MKEYRVYGPPGCLSEETKILIRRGKRNSGRLIRIKEAYHRYEKNKSRSKHYNPEIANETLSLTSEGILQYSEIEEILYSGMKKTFILTTISGESIRVTEEHPFKVPKGSAKADSEGFCQLKYLSVGDEILCRDSIVKVKGKQKRNYYKENQRNFKNILPKVRRIRSIEYFGEEETYDIIMKGKDKNYVANDFIVHNTGKTTWVVDRVEEYSRMFGKSQVSVCSLTNTAVMEASARNLDIAEGNLSTLHSRCKRSLMVGSPAESHMKDFAKEHKRWSNTDGMQPCLPKYEYGDDARESMAFNPNLSLFEIAQILRQQLIPKEKWPDLVREFHEVWDGWCKDNGMMDFTGWLEAALEFRPLPSQQVVIVDEAQDHTPLQLAVIRSWDTKNLILVGDDDQCQPQGTMILMDQGYIPVEELDPKKHGIVVHDTTHSLVRGYSIGYPFTVEEIDYEGMMFTVSAGGKSTRATKNHLWNVRWNKKARSKYVVYLMKRGQKYRIGQCALLNSERSSNLDVHARAEGADCAWILRVCENEFESLIWKNLLSVYYGVMRILSTVTISDRRANLYRSPEFLKQFWLKADKLLDYHKLSDLPEPFWIKEDNKINRRGAQIFTVKSKHLIPEIMSLPVHEEKGEVKWFPLSLTKEYYKGKIYKLEVPKYHTYIADGICTHNCLYEWSGALPQAFFGQVATLKDEKVLAQSYRVPSKVYDLANKFVRKIQNRREKIYYPRNFTGEVIISDYCYDNAYYSEMPHLLMDKLRNTDETCMIIASCGYMLSGIIDLLMHERIPFHNKYRVSNHKWNPLRSPLEYINSFQVGDRMWTGSEAQRWSDKLATHKDIFQYGKKTKFMELCRSCNQAELHPDDIKNHFNEQFWPDIFGQNLDFLDRYKSSKHFGNSWNYTLDILKKDKKEQIPRITLGTIHSVKGGEADNVFLFPDLSSQGANNYYSSNADRDRIYRLFYVGITRAKKNLILYSQSKPYLAVDWQ